jgi:hypothetical protein
MLPSEIAPVHSNRDADRRWGLLRPEEGGANAGSGALDEDEICYTMRTYLVEREYKHSDSTRPAGYTTCSPAVKFEVKTSDEHASR